MGRGRAKAKQTRVARELKYSSPNTDLSALQKELTGSTVVVHRACAREGRRRGRRRVQRPLGGRRRGRRLGSQPSLTRTSSIAPTPLPPGTAVSSCAPGRGAVPAAVQR